MSDLSDRPDVDQDRIALAGEFVLGTLPPDERARVAQEMRDDPMLRADVLDWERHLSPLAATVPPVPPPDALWRRIERGMNAPQAQPGVKRPRLSSSVIWSGVTAASFLLAAGIAFVVLMDRVPMAVPVAVLSPVGGTKAAFVVEARADGVVQVLPMHPAPLPPGRIYELWSLAPGTSQPYSLGVLPVDGRKLRGVLLPRVDGRILISLEPLGGSPTGLPTGPILYDGTVSRPD